jgi:lipid-A-disaccharide synthase-like uncharacterized protein
MDQTPFADAEYACTFRIPALRHYKVLLCVGATVLMVYFLSRSFSIQVTLAGMYIFTYMSVISRLTI